LAKEARPLSALLLAHYFLSVLSFYLTFFIYLFIYLFIYFLSLSLARTPAAFACIHKAAGGGGDGAGHGGGWLYGGVDWPQGDVGYAPHTHRTSSSNKTGCTGL